MTSWKLRKQSRQIDGVTFDVGLLPVSAGRAVLVRLTHLFGGGLAAAVRSSGEGKAEVGALGGAVSGLLERLNTEDLDWLCDQLATVTTVTHADGRRQPLTHDGVMDEVFAGRYMLLAQWLQFCVEVNYSDFFVAAKRAIGALLQGSGETPTP